MTLRGGHVLAVAAAVVAVFVCGESAPSGAATPSLLAQVNVVRASLGWRRCGDVLAGHVVSCMAKTDRYDQPPDVLDAQPACVVCERFFEEGAASTRVSCTNRWAGVPRSAALWRDGWSATQEPLGLLPGGRARARPRARTFSAARTPNGMLVVGVTGYTTARFDRAVRWPRGSRPAPAALGPVVLPRGYGYPNLYDVRDGRRSRSPIRSPWPRDSAVLASSPSASIRHSPTTVGTTSAAVGSAFV